MAKHYDDTVNGSKVTRTWSDGSVDEWDFRDFPRNVQDYFGTLGTKERFGSGGILASKGDLSLDDTKKLVHETVGRAMDGEVAAPRKATGIPDVDTLEAAMIILAPEVDEQAIAERVMKLHPDYAEKAGEKRRRKEQITARMLSHDGFRDALAEAGYTVPPKPSMDDMFGDLIETEEDYNGETED